ncbi:glycosyltransferase [Lelliottia sp. JS-SCA-14]|uniref:glycosyltransferase n=1 Tax=Lelliottia sp. JS-SCA-14 TaxID=3110110 RepID=UPI002D79C950|nr:glycosyltransferase [Lelliottia sp. JS-SCA-14]
MKQKICFFAIDLYDKGGLQRVTIDIANKLADYCNVHILTFSHPVEKEFPYKLRDDINVTFIDKPEKSESLSRNLRIVRTIWLVNKYLKKHDFDCFVSVGMASIVWTVLPQLFNRCKYVCWDHTSYLRKESWAKRGRSLSKIFADEIVTLTHKDAALWHNKKVTVIYNPAPFDFSHADRMLLNTYKKNQIVALGRFVEVKGFDRLLDIWSIVNKKFDKPFMLRIIGEGPFKEHLEQRIINERIDHVVIDSFVNNPGLIYAESKLQVLTSFYEGLSMVLIEGLIYRIPSISFDVPSGPGEVIEDCKTGFLIKDDELSIFADKLIDLMSNEKLLQELSDNCLQSRARFASDNILKQWIDLIGEKK